MSDLLNIYQEFAEFIKSRVAGIDSVSISSENIGGIMLDACNNYAGIRDNAGSLLLIEPYVDMEYSSIDRPISSCDTVNTTIVSNVFNLMIFNKNLNVFATEYVFRNFFLYSANDFVHEYNHSHDAIAILSIKMKSSSLSIDRILGDYFDIDSDASISAIKGSKLKAVLIQAEIQFRSSINLCEDLSLC